MNDKIAVDARGLSCPHPVILTQNAIKKAQKGVIEVLVDTNTSRDNVTRTAKNSGWSIRQEEERDGSIKLILTK